jgi:oligogalacturonide lyase
LLFASDRTGSPQLYQMFLNSGEFRQLTSAADLDPSSFTLAAGDRSAFFFDGLSLRELALATLRDREVYRVREGWRRAPGFNVSRDSAIATLVEAKSDVWQLRIVPLPAKAPEPATVIESPSPISVPLLRPSQKDILYMEGAGTLAVTSYDGRSRHPLPLAPGRLGPVFWAADGRTVLYLNFPDTAGKLNAIRECVPETGAEQLIAGTSQFASFSPNGDASVFVGASASKASPYVLLLLRMVRRELALCEHRASDPARVAPVFSPDSQRIYFQSDRHGKPAIYTMSVERLVEKTDS